eukprot:TRINITY_DN831_c0_g4_i2.p1 TRINITY_DN831_c0_g4~~TRINITY_DN831_c0_g4_i2.p1  ORF type:complete len:159 (+),score=13.34 TRINITY_DN831_c0_g4_i2:169-645(+)
MELEAIPVTTFNGHLGNRYEQELLQEYLRVKNISLMEAVKDAARRHDAGEFRILKSDCHPPISRSADSPEEVEVDADSLMCSPCFRIIAAELLFHYRLAIPDTEFTELTTSAVPSTDNVPSDSSIARQACWYGKGCRTQHHNAAHARRLNHACLPTRR